ncbi:MAG: tRNA (adenosine(37)-N6)-threonylcarbamoyltransferase complex transferase subunit TsaD [Lentisphaerae bacterium]|nr:tRNA (adenosine(37)-N6)-threonylcarbamoyltransferase complex transferase subunit TsaD [Lentisphaerota bacterium]
MTILGIETSCDETAAAVVRDGTAVLGNAVASQVTLHAGYGGVVPELAAREHLRSIRPVVEAALSESGVALSDLDAVAVTNAPGLVPALLVGCAYAKGLGWALQRPVLGVNHFLAHIYGSFYGHMELLADAGSFPILALVVSGGHTALVLVESDGRARLVGTTLDDAAGEAYDKAAKVLDLGYPGGPLIDRLAAQGDPKAYAFPRGLMGTTGKAVSAENRFNFSFSGVKTALLYAARDRQLTSTDLADLAASFQQAVVDVLVSKTLRAAEAYGAPTICACGGVACNRQLRRDLTAAAAAAARRLVLAEPRYCTDNAAMVAGLAYHTLRRGAVEPGGFQVAARLGEDLGRVPFAPALV